MSHAPSDRRSLLANFSALASGHAIGLLVPLLTVPYLARVLRPEGWAPVLVAQALASWMLLLLDYGFDLSATRSLAHARASARDVGQIAWSVQHAKLLLSPLAVALLLAAYVVMPSLQENGRLVFWTCALALVRGLNPFWFFQGLERVRGAVTIDAGAKVLGGAGVFVLVHGPDDGWIVLALQAAFAGVSCAWLTFRLRKVAPPPSWSLPTAIAALRSAWPMFAFRASSTLYMQANTVMLGLFASPAAVAAYGGAERLMRASINLLEPVNRLFLPRISFLSTADPARAAQMIQQCLVGLGIGSSVAAALIAVNAPLIVSVMLGAGYEHAVPVLRYLALLLPIITVATVLGTFWALPFKRDRTLLSATLTAGAVNLSLAYLLVPTMAALGMATAVITAEAAVAVSLAVAYVRWRATLPHAAAVIGEPQAAWRAGSTVGTSSAGDPREASPPATPSRERPRAGPSRTENAVHILCAVHNGAAYLAEFLESVQAQSVANWMLWIRDDGSRDASRSVVQDFAAADERIRLLEDDGVQRGVVGAFAWLLDRVPADARYVMFADQDDVWLPAKIEYTLRAMMLGEEQWSGPVLVHTDMVVVDDALEERAPSFWGYAGLHPEPVTLQRMAVHTVATGATMMLNRELRERVGHIPPEAAVHDWWVMCVASAFGRVVAVSTPTMLYRQHSANAIGARLATTVQSVRSLPAQAAAALRRAGRVRAGIVAAARQAGAFVARYGPELSSTDCAFLTAYARIPERSFLRRKLDIVRWHLRKENGLIRNAGLLLRA